MLHYYRTTLLAAKRSFFLGTSKPITADAEFVIGFEVDRQGGRIQRLAIHPEKNEPTLEYHQHLIQFGAAKFIPYTYSLHDGWLERTKGGA